MGNHTRAFCAALDVKRAADLTSDREAHLLDALREEIEMRLDLEDAAKDAILRSDMSGFPIGSYVVLDGRDDVVVKAYFPEGSTSYGFPHYKVRSRLGPRDGMVVAASRISVTRKEGVS